MNKTKMMRNPMSWGCICLVLLLSLSAGALAQDKYYTRNGKVFFNCGTSLETIKATNPGASCVLVAATGQFQAAVLMKSFEFDKDLMEQHFNENYVESDKFPKAVYAGHVVDIAAVDFTSPGRYDVGLKGKLTLHGVTREVEAPGEIEVQDGKVLVKVSFRVRLEDYGITRPGVVRDKIAEVAEVKVDMELQPMAGRP